MILIITSAAAPAMGDIRALGMDDTVCAHVSALQRRDWPRYVEAIASAVSKGCSVIWAQGRQ